MNDRCAAGTGKFLEVMANALGFRIDQFGDEALKAMFGLTVEHEIKKVKHSMNIQ